MTESASQYESARSLAFEALTPELKLEDLQSEDYYTPEILSGLGFGHVSHLYPLMSDDERASFKKGFEVCMCLGSSHNGSYEIMLDAAVHFVVNNDQSESHMILDTLCNILVSNIAHLENFLEMVRLLVEFMIPETQRSGVLERCSSFIRRAFTTRYSTDEAAVNSLLVEISFYEQQYFAVSFEESKKTFSPRTATIYTERFNVLQDGDGASLAQVSFLSAIQEQHAGMSRLLALKNIDDIHHALEHDFFDYFPESVLPKSVDEIIHTSVFFHEQIPELVLEGGMGMRDYASIIRLVIHRYIDYFFDDVSLPDELKIAQLIDGCMLMNFDQLPESSYLIVMFRRAKQQYGDLMVDMIERLISMYYLRADDKRSYELNELLYKILSHFYSPDECASVILRYADRTFSLNQNGRLTMNTVIYDLEAVARDRLMHCVRSLREYSYGSVVELFNKLIFSQIKSEWKHGFYVDEPLSDTVSRISEGIVLFFDEASSDSMRGLLAMAGEDLIKHLRSVVLDQSVDFTAYEERSDRYFEKEFDVVTFHERETILYSANHYYLAFIQKGLTKIPFPGYLELIEGMISPSDDILISFVEALAFLSNEHSQGTNGRIIIAFEQHLHELNLFFKQNNVDYAADVEALIKHYQKSVDTESYNSLSEDDRKRILAFYPLAVQSFEQNSDSVYKEVVSEYPQARRTILRGAISEFIKGKHSDFSAYVTQTYSEYSGVNLLSSVQEVFDLCERIDEILPHTREQRASIESYLIDCYVMNEGVGFQSKVLASLSLIDSLPYGYHRKLAEFIFDHLRETYQKTISLYCFELLAKYCRGNSLIGDSLLELLFKAYGQDSQYFFVSFLDEYLVVDCNGNYALSCLSDMDASRTLLLDWFKQLQGRDGNIYSVTLLSSLACHIVLRRLADYSSLSAVPDDMRRQLLSDACDELVGDFEALEHMKDKVINHALQRFATSENNDTFLSLVRDLDELKVQREYPMSHQSPGFALELQRMSDMQFDYFLDFFAGLLLCNLPSVSSIPQLNKVKGVLHQRIANHFAACDAKDVDRMCQALYTMDIQWQYQNLGSMYDALKEDFAQIDLLMSELHSSWTFSERLMASRNTLTMTSLQAQFDANGIAQKINAFDHYISDLSLGKCPTQRSFTMDLLYANHHLNEASLQTSQTRHERTVYLKNAVVTAPIDGSTCESLLDCTFKYEAFHLLSNLYHESWTGNAGFAATHQLQNQWNNRLMEYGLETFSDDSLMAIMHQLFIGYFQQDVDFPQYISAYWNGVFLKKIVNKRADLFDQFCGDLLIDRAYNNAEQLHKLLNAILYLRSKKYCDGILMNRVFSPECTSIHPFALSGTQMGNQLLQALNTSEHNFNNVIKHAVQYLFAQQYGELLQIS